MQSSLIIRSQGPETGNLSDSLTWTLNFNSENEKYILEPKTHVKER